MQHIEKITPNIIQQLTAGATNTTSPAVTIYMPTQTSAALETQNLIRLKNLITKATDQLDDQKLIKMLQRFIRQVEHESTLRHTDAPTILVCATTAAIRLLQVPVDTEEYVAVDSTFHLAPILALMNEQQEFYVLLIAQHQPKLFKGDSYGLYATGITLPRSLEQALQIDENGKRGTTQNSTAGKNGTSGFNGRGGTRDHSDSDRLQFFRIVDRIVIEQIDRSLPVILAGTDSETTEYRTLSRLSRPMERIIAGNQTNSRLDDLHAKSMQIIESEIILPYRRAATQEYLELEGANPERVAHDQKSIDNAALQGRVDKLLTSTIRYTTDSIRGGKNVRAKITFPDRDTSRQLNNLAMKVWQASGTVVSLLSSDMPHGTPVAARLRY